MNRDFIAIVKFRSSTPDPARGGCYAYPAVFALSDNLSPFQTQRGLELGPTRAGGSARQLVKSSSTRVKDLMRSKPIKAFTRSVVDNIFNPLHLLLGNSSEIVSFGKKPP